MLIPRRRPSRRALIADRDRWRARALEAEERHREKLGREIATQKARLERRHEAEMAEAERLNTLALRRADAWAQSDIGTWQERALAAEAALAGARDATLTEAWLAIRAEAGPWPYDLKDALDAVHHLRTGEKPAEAALMRDFDCCTDGHAEAGATDE